MTIIPLEIESRKVLTLEFESFVLKQNSFTEFT